MKGISLVKADLQNSDLTGADLSWYTVEVDDNYCGPNDNFACLASANLCGANLSNVKNLDNAILDNVLIDCHTIGMEEYFPSGAFIAYTKIGAKIIVLEIPADAKRVLGKKYKHCCNKAKVLRIENLSGSISSKTKIKNFEVGEIVSVENFDDDRWNQDGEGITFYMSKDFLI